MRYLALLISLVALVWGQPLSGDYFINGCSSCAANQFPSIQAAFNALNAQGASGVVNLRVVHPYDPASEPPPPAPLTLNGYTCTNCRVNLIFDTTVIISRDVQAAAGARFVFRFGGTIQNFALQGRGKLTVAISATQGSGAGTNTGIVGLVSTTTTPLTVSGFSIDSVTLVGKSRDTNFAGIYVGDDGSLPSAISSSSSAQNITISNVSIRGVSRPIYIRGSRATVQNISITGCTIGADVANADVSNATANDPSWAASWGAANNIGGIHILGAQNVTISRNVIKNAIHATSYQMAGIRLDTVENFNIERNWIYRIRYLGNFGWGSYGIYIGLPASFLNANPSHRIANNMIAGVYADAWSSSTGTGWVSGIYVTASSTIANAFLSIYHNTIHLYGNNGSTYTGGGSSGISFYNISGGTSLIGNLIQNNLKASTDPNKVALAVAFFTAPTSIAANYNCYRVNSQAPYNLIARVGTAYDTTFSQWQARPFSPDANGRLHLPGDVPFEADTNLHLKASSPSSAINAGRVPPIVTIDIDGDSRPMGGVSDPGIAPDIGADELGGTPFTCPTALQAPDFNVTTPPNAGNGTDYLWGSSITLDTAGTGSPPASGILFVIYSLDGGATWVQGPSIGSFPVAFTLPALTPPNYTGTIHIAIKAAQASGCPLLPNDTSSFVVLGLTDRAGNRPDNAILLTLTNNSNGTWSVALTDSTNGPGLSNEANPANGFRAGQASTDLFFKIVLPECFDSLSVTTCDTARYDTYIRLINATAQDTIVNDDACDTRSTIVAKGIAGSLQFGPPSPPYTSLEPDSLVLRKGDTLYVVVEGWGTNQGFFGLEITGYKAQPPAPVITGAPSSSICVSQGSLQLDATTSGASAYEWYVNGSLVSGANAATYTLTLAVGTHTVQVKAIFSNPNGSVCNDTTTSAPVSIVVDPLPAASIQVGSTTYTSGDTLTVSGSGSVAETFTATSSTSGNTYSWELYNPGSTSPDATGTGSSFNHTFSSTGVYTLILISQNGACEERDTLFIDVTLTTALAGGAGSFKVMPNPSSGSFRVEAPAAGQYELYVMDVAGHVVYRGRMEGMQAQLQLPLPAGTYQLLIRGEGRSGTVRLMIVE